MCGILVRKSLVGGMYISLEYHIYHENLRHNCQMKSRQPTITQRCGHSEYNSGMLEAHFEAFRASPVI